MLIRCKKKREFGISKMHLLLNLQPDIFVDLVMYKIEQLKSYVYKALSMSGQYEINTIYYMFR